ncbi:MAG TPA: DMT family transporter, partial [Thermoplasmata archaeon]|nr:DMT family transporter [Thermoplasmata archaeon]
MAAGRSLTAFDLTLLVVVGVAWGSAYVAIREGILAGASPLAFAAVRYALASVGFVALAAARRERLPSRRALVVSAALGTLIIGLYGALLYLGEESTPGGYASVLAATAPILTAVFGYPLLPSERFRLLGWAGIGVGFVGVVLLVLPALDAGGVGVGRGPLVVLASFAVFCVGSVLLRRWNPGGESVWQIAAQFAVGSAVVLALFPLTPGPESLPLTPVVWGWLAVLVGLSSILGYLVYFALHHRVGPGRANLVAYLVPSVGLGIGTGVFGEPITALEVAGLLLVILGVSLVFRERGTGRSDPSG